MLSDLRGRSLRSAKVLGTVALVAAMSAGGSAALAGGDTARGGAASSGGPHKSEFVSGNSTASDCGVPGSDWAISLTGDLEGCWSAFVEKYRCKELQDYDLYVERGREVFAGELRGEHGRFRTRYTLEAAYAKGFCESFDPTLQVAGGCRHRVVGGSGVFEDAEGLLKFLDVITGVTGDPVTGEFEAGSGGNNFLYYGRIRLDQDD